MKQVLNFAPTFTPGGAGAGTLNFSGYSGFSLRNLLAVINETRGVIIYCPADGAAKGYSSFNSGTSTITLSADTTGHSAGDVLSCVYDAEVGVTNGALSTKDTGLSQWVCSFANTDATGLNTSDVTQVYKSAGVTVSQSSGNLLIAAGTAANEEFLAISNTTFSGSLALRYKLTASQRIANTNLWIGLADKIGDSLAFSNPSATTVVVTIPNNPFTVLNVGQSVNLAAINGPAGCIPGRYAIASVSGNDVTFTVAGWPGVGGTGTCSLFGWNFIKALYTGTTATNAAVDAQRRGWATGDTTATINTTASPGHQTLIHNDGRDVYFHDAVGSSSTNPQMTTRASRFENIPDASTQLYLYIWNFNGSTNPASSTTWTIGYVSVETYANTPVYLAGNRLNGFAAPMPVVGGNSNSLLDISLQRIGSTTVVNGGVAGTIGIGGATATAANAVAISPVQIGGADAAALTRKVLMDSIGEMVSVGAGEMIIPYTLTAASATPADGTNCRTFVAPEKECDIYLAISAVGTTPTCQVERSFDNITFEVMPMQRVDITATTLQQFGTALNAFSIAANTVFKGKTYGAPFIRIHAIAGATQTGLVRIVPRDTTPGATVAPFTLTAVNTTESVGSANGTVAAGGVRTLTVPSRGSCKAELIIDASGGTTGTNTVVLEGSVDGASFSSLTLTPTGGGPTVTSVSFTSALTQGAGGKWEADVSGFAVVRARMTAAMTTTPQVFGALRLVPTSTGRIATGNTQTNFTSTSSATVLAANGNRKAFSVYNEGAGTLYLLFGPGTASTSAYNDQIPPGAFRLYSDITCQITGIFGSAGTARIGELV